MGELVYRTGMQPSEFDAMTRSDTLELLHAVRELHQDDVDLFTNLAKIAGGGRIA